MENKIMKNDLDKDSNGIDAQKILNYYNERYSMNLEYLTPGKIDQEVRKGFQDGKCFLCAIGDINSHHYGNIYREKNGKKYLIILDTDRKSIIGKNSICNDSEVKHIYLGEGLQKDGHNCKTFAIEMLKILSKDNFKITDSLIDFYETNRIDNFVNISNEIWKQYKNFCKLDSFKDKEIPFLNEKERKPFLYRFIYEGKKLSCEQYKDLLGIYNLITEKFERRNFEDGPTVLFDVPNNLFKNWEYAGTILQLSQSLSKQLGEFKDIKVGKKKVTLKDRADLYKARASDIEKVNKNDKIPNADINKLYPTKIFYKKKVFQNISNNKTGKDKYQGTEDLFNKNAEMYEEFSKKRNIYNKSSDQTDKKYLGTKDLLDEKTKNV